MAKNEVLTTAERILMAAIGEAYVLTRDVDDRGEWRNRHDYILSVAATPAAALRQHFRDCVALARGAKAGKRYSEPVDSSR